MYAEDLSFFSFICVDSSLQCLKNPSGPSDALPLRQLPKALLPWDHHGIVGFIAPESILYVQ